MGSSEDYRGVDGQLGVGLPYAMMELVERRDQYHLVLAALSVLIVGRDGSLASRVELLGKVDRGLQW